MNRLLITLFVLVTPLLLLSQEAVTNNGALKLHSGSKMAVFGNFTNSASASLLNEGDLYLKRNLNAAQPAMAAGTGTLWLNGTAAQTVLGSQPFKTYHLVTDNTSGLQLNTDLSVSGQHTFTNGLVTTSASNYLVYEDGATYTGSSDARHVNGWVKKTGAADFVFPVGSASYLRPVSLTALSATGTFAARHLTTTPYSTQLQAPLVNVDGNEYWELSRVSGGSARVTLNWNHSKIRFPNYVVSEITTASYNGSQWTDVGGTASGTVTGTGTITSNSTAAFALFTFGSKAFPVPLTLLQFTAKRKNGITDLQWITTQEFEVDHFEVERSDDARNFYQVHTTPAGNASGVETYTATDTRAITGTAFYRLKMIDGNGSMKLSKVVQVTENAAVPQLELARAAEGQLQLKGNLTGPYAYAIFNAGGQLVQNGMVTLNGSGGTLLMTERMAGGYYLLEVTVKGTAYRLPFYKR